MMQHRAAWYASSIFALATVCSAQTLTLSAVPSTLVIHPGQQNVPIVITAGKSDYAGPITVTLTGLPSGITTAPLVLTGGTSGTLRLNASPAAGQEGFSTNTLGIPTSWTTTVTAVGAAGSERTLVNLSLTISISDPGFAPQATAIDLPIVRIDTRGRPITSKDEKLPGTITVTSADGQTSYLPNADDADSSAEFNVRGNSTALMPKLSYNLKLTTSLDLLGAMGLRCPYVTGSGKAICSKSKTYALLANYDDKTLLRNWSGFALANSIPIGNGYLASPKGSPSPSGNADLMPWAPHSLFVELYVNGEYRGNYQLAERLKLDSHRINIRELSVTDTAADQVTGGYLLEIDEHQDAPFVFRTPHGLPVSLDDPDFSPNPQVPQQTSYISNYVNTAESALFSGNFTDPEQGWRAYFDNAAAVNFYIVNNLMGNLDAGDFRSSVYFYKDAKNPMLYMGPVWDFDISSGNVNYAPIVDPTELLMEYSVWYSRWFQDPKFKADVATQWNTLVKNGVLDSWLASIRQQSERLRQSQANNAGRWPMQGIEVWPNPQAAGSYDGEVDYFTNWLKLRISFLDSLFNSKAPTATTLGTPPGPLYNRSPVVFTAKVVGTAGPPTGSVSILSNGLLLATAPLDPGATATVTIGSLPVGAANLQAVYSGDAGNAVSASSPQSLDVAAPPASTVTSIAGPFPLAASGTPVTFTASVVGTSGLAIPTGAVIFRIDLGADSPAPLDAAGRAVFPAEPFTPGPHTVTATYAGDSSHSASTAPSLVFAAGGTTVDSGTVVVSAVLNAASYEDVPQAVDGYAAAFGTGFSSETIQTAVASPLPITMGGTTVTIEDTEGTHAQAGLIFVSPTQINFVVPPNLADGPASVTVTNPAGSSATFNTRIDPVSPALFSSDSTGKGAAAALALVFGTDGASQVSPVSACLPTPVVCRTVPFTVNTPGTVVYLSLYGTGIRGLHDLSAITVTVGGQAVEVVYAGSQGTFPGLDQVNIRLNASFAGAGEVPVRMTVAGVAANPVLVNIE